VLVSVEPGSAPLADIWTEEERVVEADTVVLVTQRVPDDALYKQLADDEDALAGAGIKGLYQIGDCLLPSLIAEAVFSGHRLAREIDSPNPRVPLPYIRERRLVNATDEDFRLDSAATGAVAG
jgi:dimethylamine/trimethylamine dehydrogenase